MKRSWIQLHQAATVCFAYCAEPATSHAVHPILQLPSCFTSLFEKLLCT